MYVNSIVVLCEGLIVLHFFHFPKNSTRFRSFTFSYDPSRAILKPRVTASNKTQCSFIIKAKQLILSIARNT